MWEIDGTHPGLYPTGRFDIESEKLWHITSTTDACYV
jgi:hypothetical protein